MSRRTSNSDFDLLPDQIILTEPDAACCTAPPSLRLDGVEAGQLASAFKALGHPVRLQIVDLLSRFGGQVCVCDVESQFDLSQPTISHHLEILREAGLVGCQQSGLWVYYFVHTDALRILSSLLQNMDMETMAT